MDKFNRTLRGYDPDEVNAFLDKVIEQLENIMENDKKKDMKIASLTKLAEENKLLKEKITHFERMENTLNNAILAAERTADELRLSASREREIIITDAKKNANRILNEALMEASKTQYEAMMLKRNISIFKRKIKGIIESQLEVVEELDKQEL